MLGRVKPNKLVVKISSGYQKYDSLTFVRPEDVRCSLFPSRSQRFTEIVKKTTYILKINETR
jgi:DNA polymerase IV (archaeal DinB-like DNA polymerase)